MATSDACKQQITKAINKIELATKRANDLLTKLSDGSITNVEKQELNDIGSKLENFKDTIERYDEKFGDHVIAENITKQEYDDYMSSKNDPLEIANEAGYLAKLITKRLNNPPSGKATEQEQKSVTEIAPTTQIQQTILQHVEEIKLPNFYGDRCEWKTFRDLCKTVIQKSDYPPIQRWVKLTNYVKGNAAKLIQGLQVTDNIYEEAITLLEDYYGDDDVTAKELLKQWHALRPAKSIAQVQELLFSANRLVRQFQSIGIDTNQHNYIH